MLPPRINRKKKHRAINRLVRSSETLLMNIFRTTFENREDKNSVVPNITKSMYMFV